MLSNFFKLTQLFASLQNRNSHDGQIPRELQYCFCRIADLRNQKAPTSISVRTDVNQPQFKNHASLY